MNGDTLCQLTQCIGIECLSGVVVARLYQVRCDVYGFTLLVVGVVCHYCGCYLGCVLDCYGCAVVLNCCPNCNYLNDY